ncbi:MAG: hypothetical protein R3B45_15215 [Bdellovibrionota bacterium]
MKFTKNGVILIRVSLVDGKHIERTMHEKIKIKVKVQDSGVGIGDAVILNRCLSLINNCININTNLMAKGQA